MAEFVYEALANGGQRSQGTLTANSEREVLAMLDARGLFPVKISAAGGAVSAKGGGRKIRMRHMAIFFSQLADLLRAGVPLLRSLEILEKQNLTPALTEVLREVGAKVADGTSLADALALHPRTFNELTVSMVRAGEEGGFLEDVLERIAQFTEQQEDLRAKVIGALAYPIFLAVAGFVVLNVLVFFFVPRFEPIFAKLEEQGELPWLTQVLIGSSQLFQGHAIPVISTFLFLCVLPFFSRHDMQQALGMFASSGPLDQERRSPRGLGDFWALLRVVIVVGAVVQPVIWFMLGDFWAAAVMGAIVGGTFYIRLWVESETGRYVLDGVRLRLPGAGAIYLQLALSRFTRILGTLLHNGIPILQALKIGKDSTGNRVLTRAIDQAAENVTHGDKLATPLSACPYLPRDVVEMIAVGEESNHLEKVLLTISESLEKRTSRQLELFVRLLEPVMLLVMAAVTLVVVAGLLLPVFKMSSAVQ